MKGWNVNFVGSVLAVALFFDGSYFSGAKELGLRWKVRVISGRSDMSEDLK